MATRTCPDCATQYLATVRRCIDCDVLLVDDTSGPEAADELDGIERHDDGDGQGTIRMTLGGWGNQLKVTLDGMLERNGIPHVWEAGDLVVSERYRDRLEELLEVVEGREVDGGADGGEDERVSLEIEGLDAAVRDRLDGLLIAAAIDHAWDDHDGLVVSTDDEPTVLDLIDTAFAAAADEPADGLDSQQILTDLFVATDRLARRTGDPRAESDYDDAVAALTDATIPYGFDPIAWDHLLTTARSLRAAADPTDTEDGATHDTGTGGDEPIDEDVERRRGLADLREQLREIV